MKISEIQKGKEEIYGGVKRESERRQILDAYSRVEGAYNKFVKKKINAGDLSRSLGSAVLGLSGEHLSAQIYAYELLLKSLAEAENPEDQNKIIEEAIFDAATKTHPVKKEYLLGILAYFSSNPKEKPTLTKLQGFFELASLNGNITNNNGQHYTHIHGTLADKKFNAIAGHFDSATAGLTVEVTITPFSGDVERAVDGDTGFGQIVTR